jgi:hypothetical protein
MKALSVKNPWAWLICSGLKNVENRTWKTNYRGRILIHAPAKEDRDWYTIYPFHARAIRPNIPDDLIFSSIIGEVDIIDCIQNSDSIWAQQNCWHWILKNAILYNQPITNVKGKLGLWEYPLKK